MQETSLPGWISFICKDGKSTISGDLIANCVKELLNERNGFTNLAAIGVNCVNPKFGAELLGEMRRAKAAVETRAEVLLLIYPNSGEIWDARKGHRCGD